jgi:UrcA family protein
MQAHTRNNRMLVTLAAMAATLGLASAAQAGEAGTTAARHDSVAVDYADLDLNSAAGNKVLYARLSAAAERACGNAPKVQGLQRQLQYRACYDSALDKAVEKVGSRELQALHATGASRRVG